LHEKNGGICRDACDAHIPTDIPLHLWKVPFLVAFEK
jgi:hypothetical protein